VFSQVTVTGFRDRDHLKVWLVFPRCSDRQHHCVIVQSLANVGGDPGSIRAAISTSRLNRVTRHDAGRNGHPHLAHPGPAVTHQSDYQEMLRLTATPR